MSEEPNNGDALEAMKAKLREKLSEAGKKEKELKETEKKWTDYAATLQNYYEDLTKQQEEKSDQNYL